MVFNGLHGGANFKGLTSWVLFLKALQLLGDIFLSTLQVHRVHPAQLTVHGPSFLQRTLIKLSSWRTVYTVHCTAHRVHCTVHGAPCALYSARRTVCTVQCTAHRVQCTVYRALHRVDGNSLSVASPPVTAASLHLGTIIWRSLSC